MGKVESVCGSKKKKVESVSQICTALLSCTEMMEKYCRIHNFNFLTGKDFSLNGSCPKEGSLVFLQDS